MLRYLDRRAAPFVALALALLSSVAVAQTAPTTDLPDLQVTKIKFRKIGLGTSDPTTTRGAFRIQIKNVGRAKLINQTFEIKVFDASQTELASIVRPATKNPFRAKSTRSFSTGIVNGVPKGTQSFTVVVDAANEVAEASESNNSLTQSVVVTRPGQ
jgi:hypothetical protein